MKTETLISDPGNYHHYIGDEKERSTICLPLAVISSSHWEAGRAVFRVVVALQDPLISHICIRVVLGDVFFLRDKNHPKNEKRAIKLCSTGRRA